MKLTYDVFICMVCDKQKDKTGEWVESYGNPIPPTVLPLEIHETLCQDCKSAIKLLIKEMKAPV